MSPGHGFDLDVEASLDNLHEIRTYVLETGRQLGVDRAALADLQLAIDEAVTNIVLYGYAGRGGVVEINMAKAGPDVVVHIRDRAAAFDAPTPREPRRDTPLADRPVGGMGLYLIEKFTDEAEYSARPGGGNELRLVKRGVMAGHADA